MHLLKGSDWIFYTLVLPAVIDIIPLVGPAHWTIGEMFGLGGLFSAARARLGPTDFGFPPAAS